MSTVEIAPIGEELKNKENALRESLRSMKRVLVAYSGGVDSAFLLKVAREELGDNAQAIIGISPSLMPEEHDEAVALAKQISAPLRVVETAEIEDPNYNSNPVNRCYFCKSHLFEVLTKIARDEDYEFVLDGTNLDDLQEWRPGAQAGTERGIRSPLREHEFSKAEIRTLSRVLGLPTWDKPAMPCLSSRIPYGQPVTADALRMIGRGEAFLRSVGLRELRVRHFTENDKTTARLEIAPDELEKFWQQREAITNELRALGYDSVLLDLEGYRRGKMNDKVASAQSQPIQLFVNGRK